MANTRGFEVVAEMTVPLLQRLLLAAYDSDMVPHSVIVPPGTSFGPYVLGDDGTGGGAAVNIARDAISIDVAPPDRLAITAPAVVTAGIANPPVPSLRHWELHPTIVVRARLVVATSAAGVDNTVMLDLPGLAAGDVTATLPGDPIPALSLGLVREYVHEQYTNGTIPTVSTEHVSFGVFAADATLTLYDDDSAAATSIVVTAPAAGQVKVTVPFLARFTDVTPPALSPFAVNGRIAMVTAIATGGGTVSANLPAATFTVEDFAPAPGQEGQNYSTNAAFSPVDLQAAISTALIARVRAAVQPVSVTVPTQAQLEGFIAEQARQALVARGPLNLWSPNAGGNVQLRDVAVRALPTVLAVAMNAGSSTNIAALTNFVPANREFAIAVDGAKVIAEMLEQIGRPKPDGGLGGVPPPNVELDPVDGHDVTLKRLHVELRDGSVHTDGDVTVKDAIAGSIDADASFEVEAGMHWADNADGTQRLVPDTLSTDVDLSGLAWFLSIFLGFLTFGIVGGIIAIVVMVIAENIAETVGGSVITDTVTGQAKGITAWPQQLEGVGTIEAKFQNPVVVEHDGLVFAG